MESFRCAFPAGSFTPAWDELAPHLLSLNLDGASLAGQLPASWARTFEACKFISLAGASLKGSLPASWHAAGAFPQLSELWLQDNPGLKGNKCQGSCLGPQCQMDGWQLWVSMPGECSAWLRSQSADSSGRTHDMHCLFLIEQSSAARRRSKLHMLAHR